MYFYEIDTPFRYLVTKYYNNIKSTKPFTKTKLNVKNHLQYSFSFYYY